MLEIIIIIVLNYLKISNRCRWEEGGGVEELLLILRNPQQSFSSLQPFRTTAESKQHEVKQGQTASLLHCLFTVQGFCWGSAGCNKVIKKTRWSLTQTRLEKVLRKKKKGVYIIKLLKSMKIEEALEEAIIKDTRNHKAWRRVKFKKKSIEVCENALHQNYFGLSVCDVWRSSSSWPIRGHRLL